MSSSESKTPAPEKVEETPTATPSGEDKEAKETSSSSEEQMATAMEEDKKEEAPENSAKGRSVKLVSKEGETFEVPLVVANMSELVKATTDEEEESESDQATEIPLPNVRASILSKVLTFCKQYQTQPMTPIPVPITSIQMSDMVQSFYVDFLQNEDQSTLFELMLAANYMDVKPLLDLTCAFVASQMKAKTPEEIRQHFGIVNDFTPEEEQKIIDETVWCE